MVGDESFHGSDLSKFEASLEDDTAIDSYESAPEVNPGNEQIGDPVEDATNPGDKQKYPDRTKQTYFSVLHVACAQNMIP